MFKFHLLEGVDCGRGLCDKPDNCEEICDEGFCQVQYRFQDQESYTPVLEDMKRFLCSVSQVEFKNFESRILSVQCESRILVSSVCFLRALSV